MCAHRLVGWEGATLNGQWSFPRCVSLPRLPCTGRQQPLHRISNLASLMSSLLQADRGYELGWSQAGLELEPLDRETYHQPSPIDTRLLRATFFSSFPLADLANVYWAICPLDALTRSIALSMLPSPRCCACAPVRRDGTARRVGSSWPSWPFTWNWRGDHPPPKHE